MIVIPMAGLSKRFFDAGFDVPKFQLLAKGESLFAHSVSSFKRYFESELFVFIALADFDTEKFIKTECERLGIANVRVVILEKPTKGQADTVYQGLVKLEEKRDEHLFIFNIDTFRPNFKYPEEFNFKSVEGYLETFIGSGKNWSNVVPVDDTSLAVKKTAEKQELSEYCCTGLYFFGSAQLFIDTFLEFSASESMYAVAGELYIAPMYNILIEKNKNIRYTVINRDDVIFCGVPAEYYDFLQES
ncbi:hypothetical protein BK026_11990 [Alteromonas sp. V450]|uniref:hypothetical protein n=1 Tax=Alteromonas sp. V450 TaxID=1912139 RepID=UPI0008FF4E28|nr:hypothetical protein [Alteromonas sp. V450]OJF69448.1 hypothetical protein BK026_11990 [Alteromonas sp. V450]